MPDIDFLSYATFPEKLFEKMKRIAPALAELELYEFCYCLDNLVPPAGWESVTLDEKSVLEIRVNNRSFYDSIQIKPTVEGRIVLDEAIICLTNMLFVGLVRGMYTEEWVNTHFYFDVRGFYFLHRTNYFTEKIRAHLGGKPYRQFEQKQRGFEHCPEIGYQAFKEANAEVDSLFIQSVKKLIAARGTPLLLAIAGPTAAGKTEIVARLKEEFTRAGMRISSIEMDNFLTDREYRETQGIFTQGKRALHFDLFRNSLQAILQGQAISIPRYDFVKATSSHDLDGRLKPDGKPIQVEPAEVVFMEGNFPFLLDEIARLISLKVVYLTDDPIRMKRKWKRDIDFRKKYEPSYFRNRFFKEQFIMAEIAYRPQMEVCDLLVDTTAAALWVTPEVAQVLGSS